jgi:pimeloyl-ACP methyl ester carboxylesterase
MMRSIAFKRIKRVFTIVLLVYVIVGIALYFFQDKILFHPKKLPADYRFSFNTPFKQIDLTINNEKNLSIVQFTVPPAGCKGVVLYFHGNRNNIERYASYASHFTRNDYEVWMMDYPGFGKSTGSITEDVLYQDAARLYLMARGRFGKDSIIIYGKSLGSGIAAQLASVRDCRQLILETPYYSIDNLMGHYAFMYPAKWMSKYHFPTYQFLEKVEAPVTVLHGTGDGIIPYSQSVKLKNKFPKINLVPVRGGSHNTLAEFPLFQRSIDSLLRRET